MIFIWIFLIIIVSAASYYLAKRSLRHYLETPDTNIPYSVFLIQSPSLFDSAFLEDLASKNQGLDLIFSFERLYKGHMSALIIYGPRDLLKNFPQLNLLELEDYTEKQDISRVLAWELRLRKSLTARQKESRMEPKFLSGLKLSPDDQVYYQIVCQHLRREKKALSFQVHMRIAVIAGDPSKRASLAKELDLKMSQSSVFTRMSGPKTSSQIFLGYKKRSIKPKEVENFRINALEMVKLLKQ